MRKKIKDMIEQEIVTTEQAGKLLSRTNGWVRQQILKGAYDAIKVGKTWLMDKQDITGKDPE